jgi:hypothetical protein
LFDFLVPCLAAGGPEERRTLPSGTQEMCNSTIGYPFLQEDLGSFVDNILLPKNQDELRHHLISSARRMGKSKFLEELLSQLRTKAPDHWMLIIDLSKCRRQLEDVKNSGNLIVEDFVGREPSSTEPAEEPLQRIALTQNGNQLNENIKGKAWILLDSLDMVCPAYRLEVKKLVAVLDGMGVNLVVATQPDEEQTVLEILPNINVHRANSRGKVTVVSTTNSF